MGVFQGTLQQGMVSLSKVLAMAPAFCLDVGNVSIHFQKVSTITTQYFLPLAGVKFICRWSKGQEQWEMCVTLSSLYLYWTFHI